MNQPSTESVQVQPGAEAAQGTQPEVAETPETETEGQETEASTQPKKPEADVWPSKARNAISKRDKRIGRLSAENEHLKRQLAERPGQVETRQPKPAPKQADFDDLDAYLDARETWREEQRELKRQQEKQPQKTQRSNPATAIDDISPEWVEKRGAHVKAKTDEARKAFPDFNDVYAEHVDDVDSLPVHVQVELIGAEHGPLAFYVLSKEGKLDDLADMTRPQAAAAIARAEERGQALLKSRSKTITDTPAPIAPNKGGASGVKSEGNMSGKELRKKYGQA